eukprot:TRINITY_DN3237_c0_g1_i6.p1 TRINITY_DN3237_c0_g1~~TRINITY_DN3237_c0_g1_i6.p1  ORF type:complete len:207 (+),score=58.03 TRINITY_DN3237_c0_g1_i6:88-708(+)
MSLLFFFFFLMIRRPPRSTLSSSSAASDVYKRQYQRRVRGRCAQTSQREDKLSALHSKTSERHMSVKRIAELIPAPRPHWVGDGFNVYPVFGHLAFTQTVSPFLMFDYSAPKRFEPTTKRRGVGDHPHRGFETVTVAFQGEIAHQDSRGNSGVIGPGDVQWMTAASGIVHNEFHSEELSRNGGVLEMCQLWVREVCFSCGMMAMAR